MFRCLAVLVFLIAVMAAPILAAGAAAPRVAATNFDQLGKPLPLPYHAEADAKAQIAAARARAVKSHKRVLIDFGGNWCLDCRLLAGVMELPEMRDFMARHFEVVTVDIGRFDHNMDVPARCGIKGRLQGVPAILIVDPRSNRVLNAGRETAMADARSLNPQALADWLASWAA